MDLYDTPRNLFVAEFIGSPKMNIITGAEAAKHSTKSIGIRPEHLTISTREGLWTGRAGLSEHLGSDTFIRVDVEGVADTMTVRAPGKVNIAMGETVYLSPNAEDLHRFDDTGLRIA